MLISNTAPRQDDKPYLKVDFVDFGCMNKSDNFFTRLLARNFTVVIHDRPDLLIYSDVGNSHLHRLYRCKKLFWTGESTRPDFRQCDFAMTSLVMDDERHCRLPYYVVGTECNASDLVKDPGEASAIVREKRGFCAFIVSNTGNSASERVRFFRKLQQMYKKIDSGGRGYNNIGRSIPPGGTAKHDFIKQYKFNLCFENKTLPGYITEKLVEAMWARCVPIYWGCPDVGREFNAKSMISRHDFASEKDFIQRIKDVDQDDDLYRLVLEQPFFHENRPNRFFDMERYADFLKKVVESDREPVTYRKKIWHPGRWRLAKRMP